VPAVFAVLLLPASAWAYRPFVSTDAAVADPKEVEIELGYFNLERTRRENTIAAPSLVLNYGFTKNFELVSEFRLEVSPEVEITDPGLSVKGVVKEGVLQDKPGLSVAVEAGLLLPSTLPREHGVGFEAIGIVSGKLAPATVHVNGGGGLDRGGHVFGIWGVIGELRSIRSFGSSARSMARPLRASGRPTRRCSASSGSRHPRTCFWTPVFDTASATRHPTGSSRLV
jgi:hypothetical protein